MRPFAALTELPEVGGRVICRPAAPMVTGELRRRGAPAVTGAASRQASTVFAATVAVDERAVAGLGVAALRGLGAVDLEDRTPTGETIHFGLPRTAGAS